MFVILTGRDGRTRGVNVKHVVQVIDSGEQISLIMTEGPHIAVQGDLETIVRDLNEAWAREA